MAINVWSYEGEYDEMREEILAAIDSVFRSGRLILGEQVSAFESEFSAFCQIDMPGIGVNSGTDALFIALKALGIGPGDEVVTVANTAVPTVAAIVSAGATPRFVDVDTDTYLMDCALIEPVLSPRTACLLPVHLYGQCVDMEALMAIAEAQRLKVLEDCAQCAGAFRNDAAPGTLGDAGAWSFYPTKILGAYGDGGMIVSRDAEVAEHARWLRQYGMRGQYYTEEHGYNSRLDEVQAAILRLKLKRLRAWVEQRRRLSARYVEALGDTDLVLPAEAAGNRHAYYLFVVRHAARDRIVEALGERDIHVNVSYPWPVSIMRGYAGLGYGEGDLPVTERVAREIFSLPLYPSLSDDDQDRVCDTLRRILRRL